MELLLPLLSPQWVHMCVVPDRPSLPADEPRALCLYSTVADHPNARPHLSSESLPPGPSSDRASPRPAMASTSSHWGTLINPDKSPAPLLEQLCLGIAQLMVRHAIRLMRSGVKARPEYTHANGMTALVRRDPNHRSHSRPPRRILSQSRRQLRSALPGDQIAGSVVYLPVTWLFSQSSAFEEPIRAPVSSLALSKWLRALADHPAAHGPG